MALFYDEITNKILAVYSKVSYELGAGFRELKQGCRGCRG
jgi:hypothetical protein